MEKMSKLLPRNDMEKMSKRKKLNLENIFSENIFDGRISGKEIPGEKTEPLSFFFTLMKI